MGNVYKANQVYLNDRGGGYAEATAVQAGMPNSINGDGTSGGAGSSQGGVIAECAAAVRTQCLPSLTL